MNAFRCNGSTFRHVLDEPYPWTLAAGARAIQLAELAQVSSAEARWVAVPDLVA